MNFSQTVIFSDSLLSQELDGETILLDTDAERYFSLDPIGTEIWALLKKGKTLEETKEIILLEYDVSESVITNDIASFVHSLSSSGLISFHP